MKETIYTIPVSEIFDEECFCPFCLMEKRLNEEEIKYALGPAMMEVDYRALTNEKGFCRRHMIELNSLPKVLPLALVHKSAMDSYKSLFEPPKGEKKKIFKKNDKTPLDIFAENCMKAVSGCVICDRLNANIERYMDTFADMLGKKDDFSDKVAKCGGFCLPHFAKAVSRCVKILGEKRGAEAVRLLCTVEKRKFEKYNEDLVKFIDSFDYKNAGKPCLAPNDTVLKTSFFTDGEFTPLEKRLDDV